MKNFARRSDDFQLVFLFIVIPSCRLDPMVELDESMETVLVRDLVKVVLDLVRAGITACQFELSESVALRDRRSDQDLLLRPVGLGGERKDIVVGGNVASGSGCRYISTVSRSLGELGTYGICSRTKSLPPRNSSRRLEIPHL